MCARVNAKTSYEQCCQMVYFHTKYPNLGKFLKVLQWKLLVFLWQFCLFKAKWYMYPMAICYILWSFGIFFRFGMLYWEKSGNPGYE
jgi:hypothetical protein